MSCWKVALPLGLIVQSVLVGLVLAVSVPVSSLPIGQAAAASQTAATHEEVVFRNGPVSLAGTLITPAGSGPYPVIVFVHGSSPNLRSAFRNYVIRLYVERGVAALIYDKRGAGQSTGTTETASLSDLADDVVAGVEYLKQRPDIDQRAIGLVGDSQAGYVIPIAVTRSPDVAFIALVSASAVSIAQQEAFSIEQQLRAAGLKDAVVDAGRKLRKMLDAYSHAVQQGQAYAPPAISESAFVRLGTYNDPVGVMQQITIPTLIILGQADSRVPAEHSAFVFDSIFKRNGNHDYTIIVYPGANHGIQVPQANAQGEKTLVYAPGYQDALAMWVSDQSKGSATAGQGLRGAARDETALFSANGMYGELPWYGRAGVQTGATLVFFLSFLLPCFVFAQHAVRSIRVAKQSVQPHSRAARAVPALAFATSFLNLLVLISFFVIAAEILVNESVSLVPGLVQVLPVFALLSCVSALCMWACFIASRTAHDQPVFIRRVCLVVGCMSPVFVLFLSYWRLFEFG